MLTGAQVRAARGFLQWTVADLAKASGVGISTIQRMESEDGFPSARGGNIEAVHAALIAAGVTFLPDDQQGQGVRWKPKGLK
ncbi:MULTISPECIES: transcriptional regulator [unclassified Afipia]|uniref:helix-turn-helix domain-containing protein n=1 Tax=unclassified Afipia TaxID=2642050 RepID=UPI0004676C17|nr:MULTISPECIES: transcriptional regulator [unclassified Afipia]